MPAAGSRRMATERKRAAWGGRDCGASSATARRRSDCPRACGCSGKWWTGRSSCSSRRNGMACRSIGRRRNGGRVGDELDAQVSGVGEALHAKVRAVDRQRSAGLGVHRELHVAELQVLRILLVVVDAPPSGAGGSDGGLPSGERSDSRRTACALRRCRRGEQRRISERVPSGEDRVRRDRAGGRRGSVISHAAPLSMVATVAAEEKATPC